MTLPLTPFLAVIGIYGLDLYSLYRSADAVINYLGDVDPAQAEIARMRFESLDHVREPQTYGYQVAHGERKLAGTISDWE